MRIVYLANIRLPTEKAHGLQIMEMCRAFARNGNQVRLVVPNREKTTVGTPWEFYGMNPEFEIVEEPIFDFIPHDRWLGPVALWLNMLQFFFSAKRAIRDFRPDIIYSRDQWFSSIVSAEVGYVYEAHDFPARVTPMHRHAWKRFSRIVTVTAGLKRAFMAQGADEEKIVVAHDAADPADFVVQETKEEARGVLDLPAGVFLTAYVGHLYPYKGADDVLEACALIPDDTVAVFVGGRPDEIARMKKRAQELGLKNVIFTGSVPHARVPLYLRAADVALLPTRDSDRHASEFLSPLKLFEYMAAGKAIIATDLPSAREILDDKSAVLVPPNNPSALASAITALRDDPARLTGLERASRDQATSRSWTARAKTVLANLPNSARVSTWFSRNRQALLFALIALILRSIYVLFFPQIRFGGDERLYIRVADVLRGASVDANGLPPFYQPLFPIILAVIRTCFGTSLIWIRLFQSLASAVTVFLMVTIAERWSSKRAGAIAGLLGSLSVPMILESGIIYTETVYTLFVTAAFALMLAYLRKASAWRAFMIGIALGLAGLTREIGFYLGLIMTGVIATMRRPRLLAAIVLIPIFLAIGAIVIRNVGLRSPIEETPAPLLSKGYEATLINPASYPDLMRWEMYPLGLWRFVRYPFRLTDVSTEVSTKSVLLSGQADRIVPELSYIMVKLSLILMHWIILASAAYGLWRGHLDMRVKILFMVAITFAAATIIISGAARSQGFEYLEPLARYRFPVEPLIMILAAIGIDRLAKAEAPKAEG